MSARRELPRALASVAALFVVASSLGSVAVSGLGLARPAADVVAAWILQAAVGALGLLGRRRLRELDPRVAPVGATRAPASWVAAARAAVRGLWFGAVLVAVQGGVNAGVQLAARAAGLGEAVQRLGAEEERLLSGLLFSTGGAWLVALVALLVAAAPLSEELFFRGYLYRLLRGPGGVPPFPAAAVSAMAFAGLHAYLVHLPALWVVGVLLALWYERSGHLASAVGAHAGANALTLALALLGRALGGTPSPSAPS